MCVHAQGINKHIVLILPPVTVQLRLKDVRRKQLYYSTGKATQRTVKLVTEMVLILLFKELL